MYYAVLLKVLGESHVFITNAVKLLPSDNARKFIQQQSQFSIRDQNIAFLRHCQTAIGILLLGCYAKLDHE